MGYRIAEAAELTGIPSTTIRFYEDTGVLSTPARSPGGYRSYDDEDLERLRFVGHARRLGLGVDALRALARAWEADDCAQVADTLHRAADDHLADLHRRIGELTAMVHRVSDTKRALAAPVTHDACHDGCPCGQGLDAPPSGDAAPVIDQQAANRAAAALGCQLPDDQVPARTAAWRWLSGRATAHEPTDDGYRLRFPPEPEVAAQIAALAAAEHACCAVLGFTMRVTADALELELSAPAEAVPLLAGLFAAGDGAADGASAGGRPAEVTPAQA